ncbi:MAG: replicative DNA helicase [Treponemataceae bacterium]
MATQLKDKIPPHNLEAEAATLGALLLDWESFSTVLRFLRSENFYSFQNQKIFKAMMSLFNKGQHGDLLTISDELRLLDDLDGAGGMPYISSLTDTVPTSANVEYYAKIVLENSVRRDLIKISAKMTAQAHDDSLESSATLEEAQRLVFELSDSHQTITYRAAKELVQESIELIEKRYHNKNAYTGIRSGFTDLDNMTSGFQKSELLIIGARPSQGKTAMALTMAQHIAVREKIPTAFFSLEMSSSQLMQRLFSSEANIPSEKIRSGLMKMSDMQLLQNAAGTFYEAPLYIVDTPNMKLLDLRSLARNMKMQHNIQIIFIDYISLITSENKNIPRHEQIAEISRSLKSLARELNIPVIALSQLTRDTEGSKPNLASLRESGAIEQDADVVMLIHRERTSKETDVSRGIETELIVAKQRNGPVGSVDLMFLPWVTKFANKE